MIITHLSMILEFYKRYKENTFTSGEFQDYFTKCINDGSYARLMLSVAYESKDFGLSIERTLETDKVFEFFKIARIKNEEDKNLLNQILLDVSEAIFYKYFVFGSKKEYLSFYKQVKEKGYTTNSIIDIFKNSFSSLRKGFVILENLPDTNTGVLMGELIRKETSESYALLEALGDPDSYPNIDSSYVYIDQLYNPDFFDNAAVLLYEWCLKNDK